MKTFSLDENTILVVKHIESVRFIERTNQDNNSFFIIEICLRMLIHNPNYPTYHIARAVFDKLIQAIHDES